MKTRILLATAFYLSLIACSNKSAKADNDFDVSVASPALKELHPNVLFDEGHKNYHTIETTYKPFARLIQNDGCVVSSTTQPIDQSSLSGIDIFIIGTAMGKEDPGDKSPFSTVEIGQTIKWVSEGGSLLLITEHYPCGLAIKPILDSIGVQVHNGYTEDTLLTNKEVADALVFTKANGNLAKHPIMDKIERINTFTGSAVKGDSTWTPLLIFSPNAQNYNVKVEVKQDGDDTYTNVTYADFYSAAGWSQGICKSYGKGKIVILAESAFLTAQFDRNGNKFGMNLPHEDNKQFVLNLVRWLAKSE